MFQKRGKNYKNENLYRDVDQQNDINIPVNSIIFVIFRYKVNSEITMTKYAKNVDKKHSAFTW